MIGVYYEDDDVYVNNVKAKKYPFSSSRKVYTVGKYRFLKLDALLDRREDLEEDSLSIQSRVEARVYARISSYDKRYFPKVIASGNGWILMERLYMDNKLKTDKHQKIIDRLIDKYDIDDVFDYNWGVCKKTGFPKIFDFGM